MKRALLALIALSLAACSDSTNQLRGFVAVAAFQTEACKAVEKTVAFRNPSTETAQRLQGVYIEPGSDLGIEGYFRIKDVVVNGEPQDLLGNTAEEVLLPPGGLMEATVVYNPKKVTKPEQNHHAALSLLFQGPELGVVQYELVGLAPTAIPGCGTVQGEVFRFNVDVATITILDDDVSPDELPPQTLQDVGEFSFVVNGEAAIIDEVGFPSLTITTTLEDYPEIVGDFEVGAIFDNGSFIDGVLEFPNVVIFGAGVIPVQGPLTTNEVKVTNTDAEFTVIGSPFDGQNMKVVFGGKLTNDLLEELDGGVITAELELSLIE